MSSNALRLMALAAMALLVLLPLPAASAQEAPVIDEYKLPAGALVDAMCMDSQGRVWLAQSSPAMLYRFENGVFQRHEMPYGDDVLIKGMSAEGSEYIWLADQQGQRIIGYDVAKDKFYNFTFPVKLNPSDVVAWEQYLWIACNMELGRLDMDTNFLKDYYVDKYTADLSDLVLDRTGNVWFVEYSTGKVGGYYRMYDQVQLFPIPTADSAPTCLGIDPKGRLWFIESGTNKLGMFDTNMNMFEELDMPVIDGKQAYPKRLALDGNGNVWLTDMANSRVIKYYPSKGMFVPISLNGSKAYPTFIESENEDIWFVESGSGNLARLQADPLYGMNPTPVPTAEPTATSQPTGTPKPTPGFEILAALAALAIIAIKTSR